MERLAGHPGAPQAPDRFLRPREAAEVLGLAPQTLAKWRCAGGGPPFCRLGGRSIRYRASELENWVGADRFRSTSAVAPTARGRQ